MYKQQKKSRPVGTHRPKKSLGQNFLISHHIKNKIITACQFHSTDVVIEIGPGKGMLTKDIVPAVKKLYVVEKDRQLADKLKRDINHEKIDIIQGDILKYAMPKTTNKVILLGNIPYNISTPIIEYAIKNRRRIKVFFMTVQLEFANRLVAKPDCKEYGALTCFVQYFADTRLLFRIKNTCFQPIPKVQSAFIRLDFLAKPRYPLDDEERLFSMIKQTFSQRRKTVLNALSVSHSKEEVESILHRLGINSRLRPENLVLDDFVKIYRELQ